MRRHTPLRPSLFATLIRDAVARPEAVGRRRFDIESIAEATGMSPAIVAEELAAASRQCIKRLCSA